jgi:glycosyltransferase involved in cell wall biosynthesis
MKQLFVTPFLPQKNAPQAGHRLAFEYLMGLCSESEVDVVVLSRTPIDDKEIEFRDKVGQVYIRYITRLDLIKSFLSRPLKFSPRFYTRYKKSIEQFICDLVGQNGYESVRLEFAQCFLYAHALRATYGNRIAILLGVHDVLIQLVLRRALEGLFFSRQTFACEEAVLKLADKVLVLCEKDAQLVRALYPTVKSIDLLPIPLPRFLQGLRRSEDSVETGTLLYWGAMQRKENEEAVIEFVHSTFLPLLSRGLNLKLLVVGSNPTDRVKRLSSDSIVVTGFVPDPTTYFESAQLGVVPLKSGAGIKLKTLEMLAAGIPVVSTPLGAEGVDRGPLLTVCDEDKFADVIEKMYWEAVAAAETAALRRA